MSRLVGGGTVFKRKDGYWVGRVEQGWSDGKRARKTVYGTSRADVMDQLKALIRNQELGAIQVGKASTVWAFLERWLQDTAKSSVRPSTFVSYSTIVKVHLIPGLGMIRLDRLTAPMVRTFLSEKRAGGLSARRCEYIHAVLRVALAQAVEDHQVPANVARSVHPPKVEHRTVAAMTPVDAQAVVAAFEGHRLEGLVTVILGLGLRLGEALALQWPAVDLEHRQLRIVATLQRLPDQDGARRWVLGEPKTRQSRRALPLPDAVAASNPRGPASG
jgi:integrase